MYSKKLYVKARNGLFQTGPVELSLLFQTVLITLNIVQKYFTFSCIILSCFSWSFINFCHLFWSLCLCPAWSLIFSNFCRLFFISLHTVPKIIHFFGKIVEFVLFSKQYKMAAARSSLCRGWAYLPPAPAEHIASKILSLESRRPLEQNFRSRRN